ncbi:MAG: hypothetical protein ABIF89_00795 [bacterium]
MVKKIVIAIIGIVIVFGLVYIVFNKTNIDELFSSKETVIPTETISPQEEQCLAAGGEVVVTTCCKLVNDFPNICAVGACGCAPEYSHDVKTCNCGEGKCFDGNNCVPFVVPEEVLETPEIGCTNQSGKMMALEVAKQIAMASGCASEGPLKEEVYSCNSITGTWWLDLNIDKPGCSPACVVNIETGDAEINWRCTGLLLPE